MNCLEFHRADILIDFEWIIDLSCGAVKNLRLGFLGFAFLWVPLLSWSQQKDMDVEKLVLDRNSGEPKLVVFKDLKSGAEKNHLLQEYFGLGDEVEFELLDSKADRLGFVHEKLKPTHQGIPLEHQVVKVHLKNGLVHSISGSVKKIPIKNGPDATLSPVEALNAAKAHDGSGYFRDEVMATPELVYLVHNGAYHLSYRCDVYALNPIDRNHIYVDAFSGEVISMISRIHSIGHEGVATTRYSGVRNIVTDSLDNGEGYRLHDYSRGGGIITKDLSPNDNLFWAVEVIDQDNIWNESVHSLAGALDAHWGAEMTYDYFIEEFDRSSFDGAGATIEVYVDYGTIPTNAFWTGSEMVFGNGGSNANPYTAIEIVAHEFSHGLIDYTADLVGNGESGALDESFCDIFGTAVDHYARADLANFELGEDVASEPARSMSNPKLYENPDTYLGEFWDFSGGNNGIHNNSGVQNHWFYLLCEGGTGTNDNGDSYSVTPIGMDAATDIAYRSLSFYLNPNDGYADARAYAIQAAIDLFGDCSQEVLSVANAWYAVGVGDPYDAIVASFEPANTYFCSSPAELSINNLSLNADNYTWDFGDGNTSFEESPIHIFTESGEFEVELTATGITSCNTQSTISVTITVTDEGELDEADCSPETANPSGQEGIAGFQLDQIDSESLGSIEGYQDFSCVELAVLAEGGGYPFLINTFSEEWVTIWLDLNGDHAFDENEELFSSTSANTAHEGILSIPETEVLNESVRLRVMSNDQPISGPCEIPNHGQVEDFRAIIIPNEFPAIAAFSSDAQFIQPGNSVQFSDLSYNLPTSWNWWFPGGIPENSTDQNPLVEYQETGTYDVRLIVSNSFGTDTMIVSNYVTVQPVAQMCLQSFSSAASGTITDSGGPDFPYASNESCTFLISPACANEITLFIEAFQTWDPDDNIYVYDGLDENAPLIFQDHSYFNTLDSPTITGYSGHLYIKFESDGDSENYAGFIAHWEAVIATEPPLANFSVSDLNPPAGGEVDFTDLSSSLPNTHHWDFGNGQTSSLSNPFYQVYSEPGTHLVELTVENCQGTDSHTQVIEVQDYPQFSTTPQDTLYALVGCGSEATVSFTIENTGTGDLIYNNGRTELDTTVFDALILDTYTVWDNSTSAFETRLQLGIDLPAEYLFSYAETAEELQNDLIGMDMLLIPRQTLNFWNNWERSFSDLHPVFHEFVRSGGAIIIADAAIDFWDYEYASFMEIDEVFNLAPNHPMMIGVDDEFNDNIGQHYALLDSTLIPLFGSTPSEEGFPRAVVFSQEFGHGAYIFIGYPFVSGNGFFSEMLDRAIEYGFGYHYESWITGLNNETDTLSPGESNSLELTLNTENLELGEYYENLILFSNDPNRDTLNYIIHLEVNEYPVLAVEDEVVEFEPIMVGTMTTEELVFFNTACGLDTMLLNLSIDSESFFLEETELSIAPGESDTTLVYFDPDVIGNISGVVEAVHEHGAASIELQGLSNPAPVMSFGPDTIFVSSTDCTDSVYVEFDIINDGGASLQFGFRHGGGRHLSLESVRTLLDSNHSKLTEPIYNLNFFENGETGTNIGPGSPNVIQPYSPYGNYLSTPLEEEIPYTNSTVIDTNFFGPGSRYFTAKYQGLFVMGADLNGIESFHVNGQLDSDGQGFIFGDVLNYENGVSNYSGFVFKNEQSYDASICRILITEQNANLIHEVNPLNTIEEQDLLNLSENQRLYLLFFSTEPYDVGDNIWPLSSSFSTAPTEEEIEHVFNTFVELITDPMRSIDQPMGEVAAFSSETIGLYLDTRQDSTLVDFPLYIKGNDPYHPTDTLIISLTTVPHSCAEFDYEVIDFCTGEIAFENKSTKQPDTWSWNFGDGNTSTEFSPIHEYENSGVYTVSLEVCTEGVCDVFQKEVDILIHDYPVTYDCGVPVQFIVDHYYISKLALGDQEFHSNLYYTNLRSNICDAQFKVDLGESYELTISRLRDWEDLPALRVWMDFNSNGEPEESEIVVSTQDADFEHTTLVEIPASSPVGIPLRMRALVGNMNENWEWCTPVNRGQYQDFVFIVDQNPEAPQPEISYTLVDSCSRSYAFEVSSSTQMDSYLWDFGDGNTSTEITPTHSFDGNGEYIVSITAMNTFGQGYDQELLNVEIAGLEEITFSDEPLITIPVSFEVNATNVESFDWDFGDGSEITTNVAEAEHTYAVGGEYTVTVSTEEEVCFNTSTTEITVNTNLSVDDRYVNAIHVYPNPAKDEVNIEFQEGKKPAFIRVFDARGILVSEIQNPNELTTLDTKNLSSGVYLLRFDQLGSVRLIINH